MEGRWDVDCLRSVGREFESLRAHHYFADLRWLSGSPGCKLCSLIAHEVRGRTPRYGLILNTTPQPSFLPSLQGLAPPPTVVPYKLPAASIASRSSCGAAPSGPPWKAYRIVSFHLPLAVGESL